jgi:predicted kinase
LIILICGYPGVGKTTVAHELAPLINAVVLSTDKIRKEFIDKPNYQEEEKRTIYKILLLIAKYLHNARVNCILDATFYNQKSREDVKTKLNLRNDQYKIIECICPEELVISRLIDRKNAYSDADISIYKMIKKIYEPIKEKHITVDTSQSLKKTIAEVVNRLQNHEL